MAEDSIHAIEIPVEDLQIGDRLVGSPDVPAAAIMDDGEFLRIIWAGALIPSSFRKAGTLRVIRTDIGVR